MVKQKLKNSEKKIIAFLENTDKHLHYARKISQKLSIEYNYLLGILSNMRFKKWVRRTKREQKVFYDLLKAAPRVSEKTTLISKLRGKLK